MMAKTIPQHGLGLQMKLSKDRIQDKYKLQMENHATYTKNF